MSLPGGEHDFYFFAGVFDDVVHVDVDLFDAEGVFVGLGYAFYPVARALSDEGRGSERHLRGR